MSKKPGEENTKLQQGPKTPFVVSLVAGILIAAGGILGLIGIGAVGFLLYSGFMLLPWLATLILLSSILEIICGLIIIIMAFVLYAFPKYAFHFGTVIIILSVLSLFFMSFGFFLVGLMLGILGGALAVTWKPSWIYPSSRSCLFDISVECPTRKVDPDIFVTTLSEKVCPVCPIRIRMGLEGQKPVKLTT